MTLAMAGAIITIKKLKNSQTAIETNREAAILRNTTEKSMAKPIQNDPKTITKKSITKIFEEYKLLQKIPEDLTFLIKKKISLEKHFEENKQDKSALRGLQLTESKIKRLVKYYKKTKKLPVGWKYDSKSIRIYIE